MKTFNQEQYGLLGRVLGHSLSPAIHAQLGDYRYDLHPVEPNDVGTFLQTCDWAGMNVTIPYKETVMAYCEALTPLAKKLGSVNTLTRLPSGGWLGDNTDYWGLAYALKGAGFTLENRHVVILGSGGSSRMVQGLARDLKAARVDVVSRQGSLNYQNLDRVKTADVLINTTPVGMSPNILASPVDLTAFDNLKAVVDIIYNPARTMLIQQAQALGIPTLNGLSMLVYQALEASDRFLDCARPLSIADRITRKLTRETQNIVLVGMPGVGKSTVGRLVAQKWHRPFVDMDKVFESTLGMLPRQYIAMHGEAAFRDRESEICAQVALKQGVVIATGGGTPLREANRALLKATGKVFYLHRDLDKLATHGRPISQSVGVEALFEVRDPLYRSMMDTWVNANEMHLAVDAILGDRP